MPRTALILGTLAGQVDAMRWLRDDGWTVHACGHRRQGPGVDFADGFHQVDILDVEAVTQLAVDIKADVIYSVGSDIAMPTIARASERLGLPRLHDVTITDTLQRKDLLRAALAEAGLSPVASVVLRKPEDIASFDAYPAIVKPTDSQGQRGITVVASADEAARAVADAVDAAQSGTAIIEEWLDGPEVSVHVFVVDGRVVFSLPSDRHVWDGPMVGIPQAHAVPSRWLDAATGEVVDELVEQFVSALGVRNGPLYFQLKLTSRGPRIIEVASRLDGCHLWRLVLLHTGLDLIGACFRQLMGETWQVPERWPDEPGLVLGFHLASPERPFEAAVHPPPPGTHVRFRELQVEEGHHPRDANGVVARVGYYIVQEIL